MTGFLRHSRECSGEFLAKVGAHARTQAKLRGQASDETTSARISQPMTGLGFRLSVASLEGLESRARANNVDIGLIDPVLLNAPNCSGQSIGPAL